MLQHSRAGAPTADRLMGVSRNGASSYRERLLVGASNCHSVHHRLHRFEMGLAFPPITGRIDETHRPFDEFHNGNIAQRADGIEISTKIPPMRALIASLLKASHCRAICWEGLRSGIELGADAMSILTLSRRTSSPEGGILASKIRTFIAEHLRVDVDCIGVDSHFRDDLGLDLLDVVELTILLEEEFVSNNAHLDARTPVGPVTARPAPSTASTFVPLLLTYPAKCIFWRGNMADDKAKRGAADRNRVAASQPYEAAYFAKKHGITQTQARALIKKHGNMRKTLDAAANGGK
jgi:acyl carrier protein